MRQWWQARKKEEWYVYHKLHLQDLNTVLTEKKARKLQSLLRGPGSRGHSNSSSSSYLSNPLLWYCLWHPTLQQEDIVFDTLPCFTTGRQKRKSSNVSKTLFLIITQAMFSSQVYGTFFCHLYITKLCSNVNLLLKTNSRENVHECGLNVQNWVWTWIESPKQHHPWIARTFFNPMATFALTSSVIGLGPRGLMLNNSFRWFVWLNHSIQQIWILL